MSKDQNNASFAYSVSLLRLLLGMRLISKEEYEKIIRRYEPGRESLIEKKERFAFYEEARRAYAVVATGENRQYANVILKKGCII